MNLKIFCTSNSLKKRKILILLSACFLHYYSKFRCDKYFEEFYINEFNEFLKDFHISILNYEYFKNFLFLFIIN